MVIDMIACDHETKCKRKSILKKKNLKAFQRAVRSIQAITEWLRLSGLSYLGSSHTLVVEPWRNLETLSPEFHELQRCRPTCEYLLVSRYRFLVVEASLPRCRVLCKAL